MTFLLSAPFIFWALASFAGTLYRADESLLKAWNPAVYRSHRLQPFPKTIIFRPDGKTLAYVSTKHQSLKKSQREILRAIEKIKPQILLIEGIHQSWGASPRHWDDRLSVSLNQKGFEAYFAYQEAIRRGIPFVGSEPGKMSEFSSLERDKHFVRLLARLMNEHQRVLVVYGAGHFVQQEDVLNQMFGRPSLH